MTYALGLLAFSGLMTAQALAALVACLYPWDQVDREDSHEQDMPPILADEPQPAFAP